MLDMRWDPSPATRCSAPVRSGGLTTEPRLMGPTSRVDCSALKSTQYRLLYLYIHPNPSLRTSLPGAPEGIQSGN